jgi:group I intron endonuclease
MANRDKILYFHINNTTGDVFYVGIGKMYRQNVTSTRSQLWKNTASKYGFTPIIMKKNLTVEEASMLETFWINVFGRKDLGEGLLVNHTNGGGVNETGRKQSKEQIENRIRHNTGLKRTSEQIERIRHGNLGLKRSDESKRKMSEARIGKKHSYEHRFKISQSNKGKIVSDDTIKKLSKKVIAFDLKGNLVGEYSSVKSAAEILNIQKTGISKVLKGVRNKVGNYKFKYKI